MYVACCKLHATCDVLHVACCKLHAACCVRCIACCMLHVACCMLQAACCTSYAARRMLSLPRCMLREGCFMRSEEKREKIVQWAAAARLSGWSKPGTHGTRFCSGCSGEPSHADVAGRAQSRCRCGGRGGDTERKRQLAAIPATWRQQPRVGGARSPQAHQGWSSSRGRRLLCATLSAAYGARLPCGKDVRRAPGVAAVRSTLARVVRLPRRACPMVCVT